jgi:Transposase C of IS166 homeodomain
LIEKLKYTIRKLRHERFGQSSERGVLLDQLELQLADLEEDAAQAEAAAQMTAAAAASEKITVQSFERRKPAQRPLPEHLPRERIVYPAPSACPCCGGKTLRKIGEDVADPAAMEGDSARSGEVLLPGLRSDHPAARPLASNRPRARWPEAPRPYPVLQVRPASAP